MGLEAPILFNSTKARLSSLVLDSMVESFSIMMSRAPITWTALAYLDAKSSVS
jgi:hypothetical protein